MCTLTSFFCTCRAQSGFEDKLLLCYTCKLQDGETQINNYSPLRQESADLSAKTVSVASCVTSNFKSTVNCIDGSIFSLFPLVEMLGKPLSVPDSNAASDSKTLIYVNFSTFA